MKTLAMLSALLLSAAGCGGGSSSAAPDGGSPSPGNPDRDAASGVSAGDDGSIVSMSGGDSGAVEDGTVPGADAGGEAGVTPAAMVNPAPGTKFFVGTNFWNIDWEGQADFFQSGVDFTTATNPWVPEFLTDLAPYSVLRFMDWNETNTSNNPQASWSTRKLKTQPQSEPVAFEWQIDLC
ncbi:MAG TPA: hypothetical protein VK762_23870, partial [Polyangiaceae bacterium]|nr:hypothetical protein [Polyangiaceae bacterium]